MTTVSYPAKGTGEFDTCRVRQLLRQRRRRLVDDLNGASLALARIDAGEIARYSPGKVRVGGYVLEVTANHDLTVSTSAATYYVCGRATSPP